MAKRKSEKQKLVERIRRKNKRVQRLYTSTKRSGEAEGFLKTQRQKFGAITKTKNPSKIALGSLNKMSLSRLKLLEHQQDLFIKSKWVTKKGRAEMLQKQYEAMVDLGYDITKKEYNVMRQLFGDDDIQELRDMKNFSSDAIISFVEDTKGNFNRVKSAVQDVIKSDGYKDMNAVQIKKAVNEIIKRK